eukprot:7451781-Pyramimonas_sp.AAC.1
MAIHARARIHAGGKSARLHPQSWSLYTDRKSDRPHLLRMSPFTGERILCVRIGVPWGVRPNRRLPLLLA